MGKRIKRFLVGSTLVSLLGLFTDECADEALFETKDEQSLEDRFDMPINFNWDLRDEERSSRIRQLENSSDLASHNWDFYPQQFSNINYISITTGDSWYNPILGSLHYFCSEKSGFCDSDRDIIHELGHVWHFSLSLEERSRFNELLSHISGNNYRCTLWEMFRDNCPVDNCGEDIYDLGSVSCYGTATLFEKVAEYFMFVYVVNKEENDYSFYPDYAQIGGFDIYYLAVPRIISTIQLLHQFGAFSEEERDYAINQLLELSEIECNPYN